MSPATEGKGVTAADRPVPGRTPVPARTEAYPIRIDRDGRWHYRGSVIRNPRLVRLFAAALRRGDDGSYWLVTPTERGLITVDDAPFLAVEHEARDGADPTTTEHWFRTDQDRWIVAGPHHPIRVVETPVTGGPRPYIKVEHGLEARIVRSVFHRLTEYCVQRTLTGEVHIGLWSRQTFFTLGVLPGD